MLYTHRTHNECGECAREHVELKAINRSEKPTVALVDGLHHEGSIARRRTSSDDSCCFNSRPPFLDSPPSPHSLWVRSEECRETDQIDSRNSHRFFHQSWISFLTDSGLDFTFGPKSELFWTVIDAECARRLRTYLSLRMEQRNVRSKTSEAPQMIHPCTYDWNKVEAELGTFRLRLQALHSPHSPPHSRTQSQRTNCMDLKATLQRCPHEEPSVCDSHSSSTTYRRNPELIWLKIFIVEWLIAKHVCYSLRRVGIYYARKRDSR